MRISEERLKELLQEEYRAQEDRLRVWVQAAEAELEEKDTPREQIYYPFLWTQTVMNRLCLLLDGSPSHLEARAFELVCAMSKRIKEARGEEEDINKLLRWLI